MLPNNKISLAHIIRGIVICILLLVASSAHASTQELIVNGGFESGSAGWMLSGAAIPLGGNQHTGTRYAVLGEFNNTTDLLSQILTVPANAGLATASFYHYIYTEESATGEYDTLEVDLINLTTGTTYPVAGLSNLDGDTCSSGSSCYQFFSRQIDFSGMDGNSIQLRFRSTMDVNTFTSFKIDDVSLLVTIDDATPVVPITANTINPSLITDTSARLTGTFAPGGLESDASFQWRVKGTSALYHTPPQSVGSGYTNVGVNEILTGLIPETTYEYRAVGTNAQYVSYGAWISFTTQQSVDESGCTDPSAINYSPTAEVDDGSCEYDEVTQFVRFPGGADTQYANSVIYMSQGQRVDGSPVPADRSDTAMALGVPESDGSQYDNPPQFGTFTSLGFGGSVTLGFAYQIPNTDGPDISLFETSGGVNYPPERVQVEASSNGTTWVTIASDIAYDGSVDLGSLSSAQYVRITDVSDSSLFEPTGDGYDLDAVAAKKGEPSIVAGCTDPTADNYDPEAEIDNGSCEHEPEPLSQCSDGIDNDGDGSVDGEDLGCETSLGTTEDTAPAFFLIDEAFNQVYWHSIFDPLAGLHAFDEEDGEVTEDIVVISSEFYPDPIPGTYDVLYQVEDSSGQVVEYARSIEVLPITAIQALLDPEYGSCVPLIPTGHSRLVCVVHGWNGSSGDDWVVELAAKLRTITADVDLQWDVAQYDWSEDAESFLRPKAILPAAPLHGKQIAEQIAARGYDEVHFIAHSAGSQVVQTAIDVLKNQYPADATPWIHATFLDAYAPDGRDASYGQYADFAEQYVDSRDSLMIIADTNRVLENAYNFVMTDLEDRRDALYWRSEKVSAEAALAVHVLTKNLPGIASDLLTIKEYLTHVHAWPHQWYRDSITVQNIGMVSHAGFPLAKESGWDELFPTYYIRRHAALFPSGVCDLDTASYTSCPQLDELAIRSFVSVYQYQLDLVAAVLESQSETGVVTPLHPGMQLQTGSPVWFTTEVTLAEAVNTLSFDYTVHSPAGTNGILTMTIDGEPIFALDETALPRAIEQSVHNHTIGEIAAGTHVLQVAFENNAPEHSVIDVKNIRFDRVEKQTYVDSVAPTTALWLRGVKIDGGVYTAPASVAMVAEDGLGGIGVEKTEYSFDGEEWFEYTGTTTVSEEGEYTVYYRSTDWFENVEDTKNETFEIVSAAGLLEGTLAWAEDNGSQELMQMLSNALDEKFWEDRNTLKKAGGQSVRVHIENAVKFLTVLSEQDQVEHLQRALQILETY